jgi:opacity protein-like surface antigen
MRNYWLFPIVTVSFLAVAGSAMAGGSSKYSADLDDITVAAFGLTVTGVVDGDVKTLSGMAHVFYDFDLDSKIMPYLGVARIDVDIGSVAGVTTAFDDSDTVFAYQGMAGLRYPLTDQISIRGEYRLFATVDPGLGVTEG